MGWGAAPFTEITALAEHFEKNLRDKIKFKKLINLWPYIYNSSKGWGSLRLYFKPELRGPPLRNSVPKCRHSLYTTRALEKEGLLSNPSFCGPLPINYTIFASGEGSKI